MEKTAMEALLLETKRRQRRKTDLAEFNVTLREMMELNISLPVILGWLEKQGQATTLPALRRYIRRVFGEAFYDEFLVRNGWQRTKQEHEKRKTMGEKAVLPLPSMTTEKKTDTDIKSRLQALAPKTKPNDSNHVPHTKFEAGDN